MANDCPAKHRAWYIDFNNDPWRLSKLTFTKNKTFVNLAEADTSHSSDAETEDTNLQDSHEKRTNNRMKINQDSKDARAHDDLNQTCRLNLPEYYVKEGSSIEQMDLVGQLSHAKHRW